MYMKWMILIIELPIELMIHVSCFSVLRYWQMKILVFRFIIMRRAGSDGSMSASDSEDPGFDPQRGRKFSFENIQPRG